MFGTHMILYQLGFLIEDKNANVCLFICRPTGLLKMNYLNKIGDQERKFRYFSIFY